MKLSDLNRVRNELVKLAQVGTHQQETEWTCSAACLRAALMHFGYDLPESELASAIGAKENRGAETTDIVNAAKKLGFESWEQSFRTLEVAKEVLQQGIPIIADIQSFNHPGKGHYVLLAGYDSNGFKVMDPNTKGKTVVPNWRILPDSQLEEIWWDRAMQFPHEIMPRWGVMLMEPLSKTSSAFVLSTINELVKLGSPSELIEAMVTGAKALGIIGAGIGFANGANAEGDPSGPIKGAVSGAIKGAIIGALLALGIHHNGITGTTIPKLFK